MNNIENIQTSKSNRGGVVKPRDYPTMTLDSKGVLDVVSKLYDFGGSATKSKLVSQITNTSISRFISSAKQYGLIKRKEGSNDLILTDLGIEYAKAKDDRSRVKAVKKAILNISIYSQLVAEKVFDGNPPSKYLKEIFLGYGVPQKDTSTVAGIFRRSLSQWSINFEDLKRQDMVADSEKEEDATENVKDASQDAVSAARLVWMLSYIESNSDMNRESLRNILNSINSISAGFPEVTKRMKSLKETEEFLESDTSLRTAIVTLLQRSIPKDLGMKSLSDLLAFPEEEPVKEDSDPKVIPNADDIQYRDNHTSQKEKQILLA